MFDFSFDYGHSDEYLAKARRRRLANCVAWNANQKWEHELNIKASTYKPLELFPGVKGGPVNANGLDDDQVVDSPCGTWRYCVKVFQKGETLYTYARGGEDRGTVMFNGNIRIPALHDNIFGGIDCWSHNPWMSLTPMEIISLRAGTRRAKGDVIVAGMGLGHQLIEVSKRKTVKRLTLVEKDKSLVNWLFPVIEPHLGCKVDVVVGDAYEAIPKLKANVVLLDIFRGYGGNNCDRDRLLRSCRRDQFDFVWAWGG